MNCTMYSNCQQGNLEHDFQAVITMVIWELQEQVPTNRMISDKANYRTAYNKDSK